MSAHLCPSNPCPTCYPQTAVQAQPAYNWNWLSLGEPNCSEGGYGTVHKFFERHGAREELFCQRCGKIVKLRLKAESRP